jgi:hypothetical protein
MALRRTAGTPCAWRATASGRASTPPASRRKKIYTSAMAYPALTRMARGSPTTMTKIRETWHFFTSSSPTYQTVIAYEKSSFDLSELVFEVG